MFCLTISYAQDYKTHKVKVGETIEDIARNYMVTPFDLYALNPDAKTSLTTNTVLIIPRSKIASVPKVVQVKEVKDFKTHKVRRKETLFSISKKYQVTIDDIKKYNKRLYSENLRKGSRIKIPLFKTVLKEETLANTIKKYKVLPKEGKWRIAYKFGVTVNELEKLNPKIGDSLQVGQEINVPNIATNEEKTVEVENYNYYTVLPKEGFYRLKLKLGIEQEELERLNPSLSETGLKAGMVIKVPLNIETNLEGSELSDKVDLAKNLTNLSTKHLAVMLPFRLNRVDVDSIRGAKRLIQTDPYLRSALDFHSGLLMALNDAKNLGISTVLDVYDTRNQLSEVSNILDRNDFSSVDAVIGPFMTKNVDRVTSHLKRNNTPVFVPLASDIQLRDNVFQTVPSDDMQLQRMVNFIKQDSMVKHIIVISDAKHKSISDKLKKEFSGVKQILSKKDKDGKDLYHILIEDIEEEFKEGKNIVFLHTKNEGFVSNVSSMLNSFIDDKHEIIFMTTKHNRAFEGKNVSNYHLSNLKFHYPSVNKPTTSDSENSFVKQYKSEYGVAPNKFAVRGYDLTMDVLLRLASQENIFDGNVDEVTEYTENKFQYSKKIFGGYYNQAMYIVKYDDLKIIEAN
jgi:LysM repeat protein